MSNDTNEVQRLFLILVALPNSERQAVLDRECGSNLSLRRQIEALLAVRDESGGILQTDIRHVQPTVLSDDAEGEDGREVVSEYGEEVVEPAAAVTEVGREFRSGVVINGRYAIQEKIGAGGMGEVWSARQIAPV